MKGGVEEENGKEMYILKDKQLHFFTTSSEREKINQTPFSLSIMYRTTSLPGFEKWQQIKLPGRRMRTEKNRVFLVGAETMQFRTPLHTYFHAFTYLT